jgi:hypothetical protein
MRKNFIQNETGQVLLFVTITMALTMLIIPPLLNFVGGAGRSAQVREDRMLHVYAADAGVEEAYYRIQNGNISPPWEGTINDVNGCDVTIALQQETENVYKIISTATSWQGADVTVEAYAASIDYSYLFDNALSSYGDITLRSGTEVHGNITYNGEMDNKGTLYGNDTGQIDLWPEEQVIESYYKIDLGEALYDPYEEGIIALQGNETWGPLYRPGDLVIKNSLSPQPPYTLVMYLSGTIYIEGALDIGGGAHEFILDLDGEGEGEEGEPQVIFCEETIDIGNQVKIRGSGCIIGVGDVYFTPNTEMMNPDDFIFVMSVSGELQAQPNGTFYGAMAGLVEIMHQPGSIIQWHELQSNLNFPQGDPIPGVRSYIIKD